MENQLIRSEQKLEMIMQHASMGLAEIDRTGKIIHLNTKGEALLKPIWIANGMRENNLYPVLEQIAPALSKKIKESPKEAGQLLANELHSFSQLSGGERIERHFNFMVIKIFTDCIIVGFEDIGDKYCTDKVLQQAILDRAIVLGKYEIASNVLHDIGNAVVGFSAYLNRIKHSLELDNSENLQNLVGFFETQQSAISAAIGDVKADAVIKILSGIVQTQKNNQADISKSIKEQQNIITHIQEILNIQRQYVSGNGTNERNPIHLDIIINDCMSMLFASLNKRNITVSQDIPGDLPLINGDRTKLMQVILNILKNSIEAIDVYAVEKSISITIASGPGLLTLRIQDSGKGFDEATGKKLFTRGFTTKSSGTGLGLSSCRAIIESYDGTIDIASCGPGKGAVTTIEFKV
ncbi:MAG: HAMP domain-containing sensor histidine kinase [Chitinophagaceae bacterium]